LNSTLKPCTLPASRICERAAGRVRGPLHGIPVFLKDNIETGDTQQTSAGAFGLVGLSAARDAFIVERLRQQGG
jgi:amidase